MIISFARAELSEVHAAISRHLDSLPGPTDPFLEDHVRDSKHYVISVSGARAGFAAIHAGNLITQFSLEPAYQRFGQATFQALRKLEYVSAAFVPTCDDFYLSHAIDDYRQLAKQAYFFEAPSPRPITDAPLYSLKRATAEDAAFIGERSGGFFDDMGPRIERGELFLTHRETERVAIGIMEKSRFRRDVAGVGMFTLEEFRRAGVGTATIALLLEECSRLAIRPVAGCWYYNHASKRTLERAGMVARTRLLRVEY
jgi:GNAT superfamily N-acetyltransferase